MSALRSRQGHGCDRMAISEMSVSAICHRSCVTVDYVIVYCNIFNISNVTHRHIFFLTFKCRSVKSSSLSSF
jgi:hypothetical protein